MNKEKIQEIFRVVRANNSNVIPEVFSKQIFEYAGVNIPKQEISSTEDEAVYLAKKIGFPVVLKIHSFQIVHKSDAKGVLVGLKSSDEVREGFREIIQNAAIYNKTSDKFQVTVQEMAEPATEIIIGMKRDEIFGPVILFGLGGVWVEVLKDVSLRVLPLTERDVELMFTEIKGTSLLEKFRGNEARDLASLKNLIFQLQNLVLEFPEINEIDLNPVFLYEKGHGNIVVDARIVLNTVSSLYIEEVISIE
ncbi:acetate--CoA ligase family protein [Planococcus salinus]|uniref:Acetyl-CoA synthetase n=1 Tax=Planococcus salinus TaxID=1848460 RepID=A0A3M8P7S7_9BACL|nr:acetate--CoA ligase family protein [Planococcus salinus]RNF39748.1 acetyl-CoA synthetase [Planococcus salinus]